MADIRTAKKLRRWFPPRYIGVAVQFLIGLAILTNQAGGAGSIVAFFQRRTHIDSLLLGGGFIVSGLISLITRNIRVYLTVNLFVFGSYTLVGLYAWLIEDSVPPAASILAFGVCLFTLWTFPELDDSLGN